MILKATDLKKSYQKCQVLSGVSLDLNPGKSIAICGRSGEGKTTLLHILGAMEMADSGSLEIEGDLVRPSNAALMRRECIGFVFQAFHLLEDFTAIENVLMPAKILRQRPTRKMGLELLNQVGLLEKADSPVKLLSGGERQRVAIARALCNDPKIIMADEPSGNLDAANASAITDLLLTLVRQKKKSLICVTHDERLASLCDQTLTLSSGKLVADISFLR